MRHYPQPFVDIDTTAIYNKLKRRRRAYQRERLMKQVCPWIIAASSFGSLIYVLATKVF